MHGDDVARLLADRPADLRLDRQLVAAVAERHERAAEGDPVDRAAHLDEPAGAEGVDGAGPDEVRVAAARRAPLQPLAELDVETAHAPKTARRAANHRRTMKKGG